MKKWPLILFLLFLTSSCGKNTDEKTADAILSANIALSKGNCQSAITTLESHGRVNDNAAYLKTLASAYACRAGYSTTVLFATNLTKLFTPVPAGPLNGAATFTTSQVTAQNPLQNDPYFRDLQTAIDILLYAGGIASTTEPTATERAKYFSSSEAGDINAQLLYMILVQLGKYMYVYGDSSAAGVKGGGIATNNCFTNYTNVAAPVYAGTCANANSSHLQLGVDVLPAATRKTRLCQGVVLLNAILALLPSVISSLFSSPADQASANAIINTINVAKAALPVIGTVITTLNQSTCEDNANVSVIAIETYFNGMFEKVFL